jgi:hypothetical protein
MTNHLRYDRSRVYVRLAGMDYRANSKRKD